MTNRDLKITVCEGPRCSRLAGGLYEQARSLEERSSDRLRVIVEKTEECMRLCGARFDVNLPSGVHLEGQEGSVQYAWDIVGFTNPSKAKLYDSRPFEQICSVVEEVESQV